MSFGMARPFECRSSMASIESMPFVQRSFKLLMSPLLLHRLWQSIQTAETEVLLDFDDRRLVGWLLERLEIERPLARQEIEAIECYIRSKRLLIRDTIAG
jgi:hypothetical protein